MSKKIKKLAGLSFVFLLLFSILNTTGCASKKYKAETKSAEYYYNVGISYLNVGENSKAIYNLNKALELDPNNPDILNALGIAYSSVHEYEKAKQYFKRAIEINPDKAEIYTNLGVIYAQEKNYGEAIKYFEKAITNPNYLAKEKAFYNLALVYKRLGDEKNFEKFLVKSISYNSTFLPGYVSLGNYYLTKGRYEEAKNVFLKAINDGLTTPEIYLGLGKTYYALGNKERAKYYIQKAYKMAGNNLFVKNESKKLLQYLAIGKEFPYKVRPSFKKSSELTFKEPVKEEKIEKPVPKKETVIEKIETVQKEPEQKQKKIRFYIQVGIFSNMENAKAYMDQLKQKDIHSEIVVKNVGKKKYYLVIVGYFKNYLEASTYLNQKLKPNGLNGIIKITRL